MAIPLIIEFAFFAAYVALGVFAWGVLAWGIAKGRQRIDFLDRPPRDVPPTPLGPASVCVIVPARNEADCIVTCVRSLLAQQGVALHVLVIDDRSTDATPKLLDALAAEDDRLLVLHKTTSPPAGWVGKTAALHAGVAHLRSLGVEADWLVFVDADVTLEPSAVAKAVDACRLRRFDLLTLLLRLAGEGFWERLLIPLGGVTATTLYLAPFTNLDIGRIPAFANGQFIAVRRTAYEAVGGHEAVRQHLCEDIALARLFQRNKLRPRVAWGGHVGQVRMYRGLSQTVRGFARIFYGGSAGRPWRVLAGLGWLLLTVASLVAALVWGVYRVRFPVVAFGGAGWLLAVVLHAAAVVAALALVYRHSRHPWWLALAWPVGLVALAWVLLKALVSCVTGRAEWRGQTYTGLYAEATAADASGHVAAEIRSTV
ncbi:MAG: glycosyltransferase [Phycisphaerae bacterium]